MLAVSTDPLVLVATKDALYVLTTAGELVEAMDAEVRRAPVDGDISFTVLTGGPPAGPFGRARAREGCEAKRVRTRTYRTLVRR